jgi:hypothetical protein
MNKWFDVACLAFVAICISWASPFDFVISQQVDLNGDGVNDSIWISTQPDGEFTLYIGANSVTRSFKGGDPADGFLIVDVLESDKYKEVAVHSPGPSSDDEYYLFWYDGKSIHEMSYLFRWPTFYGNGIVNVDNWMDFWSKTEKYVLNQESRELTHVPQELYYVGIEANVRQTFPIYRTRSGSDIVANLKENSTCLVLVCDISPGQIYEYWYLIKASSGLVGWARGRAILGNLDLPLAD